jgi:hypothetical protein
LIFKNPIDFHFFASYDFRAFCLFAFFALALSLQTKTITLALHAKLALSLSLWTVCTLEKDVGAGDQGGFATYLEKKSITDTPN